MDLDANWTTPIDINEETDARITLNETFKRRESFLSNTDDRNRLRFKFEKYFQSMNEELIQAINGLGSDRSTKMFKSQQRATISSEIILMVLYCLQPTVRSKISVFNFNKGEKLSETILRSICKGKNSNARSMRGIISVFSSAVDMKIQEKNADRSVPYLDYLLELALDWDCINTAKEWIVQDSLDNIYNKKAIFYRALTKQRHKFVHYFIQLGLELEEVFFHPKINPFAARNYNKNNKRYNEFLKILYSVEAIVCIQIHFEIKLE